MNCKAGGILLDKGYKKYRLRNDNSYSSYSKYNNEYICSS